MIFIRLSKEYISAYPQCARCYCRCCRCVASSPGKVNYGRDNSSEGYSPIPRKVTANCCERAPCSRPMLPWGTICPLRRACIPQTALPLADLLRMEAWRGTREVTRRLKERRMLQLDIKHDPPRSLMEDDVAVVVALFSDIAYRLLICMQNKPRSTAARCLDVIYRFPLKPSKDCYLCWCRHASLI